MGHLEQTEASFRERFQAARIRKEPARMKGQQSMLVCCENARTKVVIVGAGRTRRKSKLKSLENVLLWERRQTRIFCQEDITKNKASRNSLYVHVVTDSINTLL